MIVILGAGGCSNQKPALSSTEVTTVTETSVAAETTDVATSEAAIETEEEQTDGVLSTSQQRALAFGAVLTSRNNMDFQTLEGMDQSLQKDMGEAYKQLDREQLKMAFGEAFKGILANEWSITDRDSAIENLEWLRDGGHHQDSFDEILLAVQSEDSSEYSEIAAACEQVYTGLADDYQLDQTVLDQIKTVSAWDYDRLVTVSRWCYLAGYITESEAWEYIETAAQLGSEDYDSWEAYFAAVMLGRAIWVEHQGFDPGDRAVADRLLQDENSIYKSVSFK